LPLKSLIEIGAPLIASLKSRLNGLPTATSRFTRPFRSRRKNAANAVFGKSANIVSSQSLLDWEGAIAQAIANSVPARA
jgi:hypothetical protein